VRHCGNGAAPPQGPRATGISTFDLDQAGRDLISSYGAPQRRLRLRDRFAPVSRLHLPLGQPAKKKTRLKIESEMKEQKKKSSLNKKSIEIFLK